MGISNINKYSKYAPLVKGVASALPYVGTAIGVIDFFVKGAKKDESTGNPSPPANFDVRLKFYGEITGEDLKSSILFKSPGSKAYGNIGSNLIPTYDNIPGVFNILQLPDFEAADLWPNFEITNESPDNCTTRDVNHYEGGEWIGLRQYRPKSNIKYVLNRNSNLSVESIEAAVVFEYTGLQKLHIGQPGEISNSIAMPFHKQMGYLGQYVYDPNARLNSTLDAKINSIENSNTLYLDYVSSDYPTNDLSVIKFRTAYFPITCFTNMSFVLLGTNNYAKSYIKLLVKLKRIDDPNAEDVTMVMTFDLKDRIKNASNWGGGSGTYLAKVLAKTESSIYDLNQNCTKVTYSSFDYKDFSLLNLPFGGNQYFPNQYTYNGETNLIIPEILTIPDNSVIPSNSILKAGFQITIGNNVTIGNNSVLMAGKHIKIGVASHYNNTVKLLTRTLSEVLLGCTNGDYNALKNTDDEVRQFCSSNKYKQLAYQTIVAATKDSSKKEKINSKLSFSIYPNPNNGSFTITLDEKDGNRQFTLFDVTGKPVLSKEYEKGQTIANVETLNLAPGVYLATIRANGKERTEKLIIQTN